MSQFTARARLLSIIVESQALDGQEPLAVRHSAEEIDHGRMAQRAGAAEGQVANRPQMVFELAGHAAFDGPMPRIVDSRGHFVGNQASLDDEEFDREDADVGERVQHALQIDAGAALEPGVRIWRNAVVQNPAAVTIGRERIEHRAARRGTSADDGYFARKWLKFLVDQP